MKIGNKIVLYGYAWVLCTQPQYPANAAEGDSLWSQTYGGISFEAAYSLLDTPDGGYLLAGGTSSFGSGFWDMDMWLVKTAANGDSLWSRHYGYAGDELATTIIATNDQGYLLAGFTSSFGIYSDMWLVKINCVGDSLWSKTYGDSSHADNANDLIQTQDGGYLLAGRSGSSGATGNDALLVKTDSLGNLIWSRTYGESVWDEAVSVIETSDDGYLFSGVTTSYSSGTSDMWLVKTDAQGEVLWSSIYGGNYGESASAVLPSNEGGYLIAGGTSSFGSGDWDMWLVKTNAWGDSLDSKTYGGSGYEYANSIIMTNDGGYLLTGQSYLTYFMNSDMIMVKTDSAGNSLWSRRFGGVGFDEAISAVQNEEGNYLLAGDTELSVMGNVDMWLVCVEGPQSQNITVNLRPITPPIQIPASGGSFSYNVSIANNTTSPQTFDAWIMVQLPSQVWYGPVLGPINLTLPASTTLTRLRTQYVPASAPAGNYLYEGRVGDYPDSIWDSDNFPFAKLGDDDGGLGSSEWMNTGESFEAEITQTKEFNPSSFFLLTSSPNPFNPSTVLSFELRAASFVQLEVFDTQGRSVGAKHFPNASPLSGSGATPTMYAAGAHQLTFDGSDLPSGLYFAKLTVAPSGSETTPTTAVQKLVLLK